MEETVRVKQCADKLLPFERLMYQVARHRLASNRQDAEDAFSEARLDFLKRCLKGAVKNLPPASLGRFLKNQVIWQCNDIYEKHGREPQLVWDAGDPNAEDFSIEERLHDPDLVSDPVEDVMKHVLSERLTQCLDALPEHYREAFLTVYEPRDTRTYAEAAELLGIPLRQLNYRLFAARRSLQACLTVEIRPL